MLEPYCHKDSSVVNAFSEDRTKVIPRPSASEGGQFLPLRPAD